MFARVDEDMDAILHDLPHTTQHIVINVFVLVARSFKIENKFILCGRIRVVGVGVPSSRNLRPYL